MGTAQTTSHASTIGAMAAGKLLAKATGGRLWPTLLILAAVVLVQRGIAARTARKHAAMAALPGAE